MCVFIKKTFIYLRSLNYDLKLPFIRVFISFCILFCLFYFQIRRFMDRINQTIAITFADVKFQSVEKTWRKNKQ